MDRELLTLVRRAKNGDGAAFDKLCEIKARSILYLCIRLTGSLHDGEDAAQEVLLKMQKGIRRLKEPEAFDAWLNRIISFTCIDTGRKAAKTEGGMLPDDMREMNIEFLPAEFAEQADKRRVVLECMEMLPQRYREVLLLFYYQDLTTREIASSLKCEAHTVETRLYRARKALKKQLEKTAAPLFGAAAVGMAGTMAPAGSLADKSEPVLRQILLRDAMGLVQDERIRRLLLAAGGTAGAATAAGTAAGMFDINALVACALAVVVAGTAAVGGVTLASPSSTAGPAVLAPPAQPLAEDPQLGPESVSEAEAPDGVEDGLYIEESSRYVYVPGASSKASSAAGGTGGGNGGTAVPDGKERQLAGSVVLASRQGVPLPNAVVDFAGLTVIVQEADGTLWQTETEADGSYSMALPQSAKPALLWVQPQPESGFAMVEIKAGAVQPAARMQTVEAMPLMATGTRPEEPGAPDEPDENEDKEKPEMPDENEAPDEKENPTEKEEQEAAPPLAIQADADSLPTLYITDVQPPAGGVFLQNANGETLAFGIDPHMARVDAWDNVGVLVSWQVLRQDTGEAVRAGTGTTISLTGLSGPYRYTLVVSLRDAAGNVTELERTFRTTGT